MVPTLDAVAGRHDPSVPGRRQCHLGFGDSLPVGPPPIADGIATTGCDMGGRNNLVRDATGGLHSQPATKQCSGLIQDAVVLENVK